MSPPTDRQRRQRPCDRLQPCANCIKRDKKHLCVFTSAETSPLAPLSAVPSSGDETTPSGASSAPDSVRDVSESLGYAKKGTAGTLWLLRMAGAMEGAESVNGSSAAATEPDASATAARYKDLVRRLPAQPLVDVLVKAFFANVAWYCDVVDEADLAAQLHAWSRVSYAALHRGPRALPPDVRAVPCLLFQILAQALLYMSHKQASALWDKLPCGHVPGMTLTDLAVEYSDAGGEVAALLGSKDMTLAQVQAGLLRAAFRKSTATVVEAWHTLGGAIRDGQELGLHCMDVDVGDSPVSETRTWHDVEVGARVWLALHLWDGHMGVVLGRPTATRVDADAWLSWYANVARQKELLRQQLLLPGPEGQHQAPIPLTPFSFMMCGYEAAYRYLQDIQDLQEGSDPNTSVARMQAIHDAIVGNMRRLPAWATAGHSAIFAPGSETGGSEDDSGNDSNGPPWLPAARETLVTEVHFTLQALHRPWLFSRPASRDTAHRAALTILASQSRLFAMAEPRECMPFNLIFATFDSIVLLSTLSLLFPDEKADQRDDVVRSIEWGVARLGAMRASNAMAACAYDVVKNLYTKVLSQPRPATAMQPAAAMNMLSGFPAQMDLVGADDAGLIPQAPPPFNVFSSAALAGLPPPQPLHDLILQAGDIAPDQSQLLDLTENVLGYDVSQMINQWL